MRFKLRNISLEIQVTVGGYLAELEFVPFRWSFLAFRNAQSSRWTAGARGFHIFAGPFHVWTSNGFSAPFEVSFKIGQNPSHGTPLVPTKEPRQ